METYNNAIIIKFDTEATGNAGSGKEVTVLLAGSQIKADLFNVGLTPIDNPVTADSDGNYTFTVSDGNYDIVIDKGLPTQRVIANEPIFNIDSTFDSLNPDTLAIWQADLSARAGDVVTTKERITGNGGGGTGDVIAGTGTANGLDIVAHGSLSLSFSLRYNGQITPQQMGAMDDGTGSPSAAFERIADIATILVKEGTFANVKISNKTNLRLNLEGGGFISAASSNAPALWLDTCALDIQGNIFCNGNKANNVNSFTDSNLTSATATLSIEDCSGAINGNLNAVNAYHDAVSLEGNADLDIVGNILCRQMKNRGLLATGGMTNCTHTGDIILRDNDNINGHGIRFGSLASDPDTTNNIFGNVIARGIRGIDVLFETHESGNTIGNINSLNSGSPSLKIEENDGTTVGNVKVVGGQVNGLEQVVINSATQVTIGDLTLNGSDAAALFIDSNTTLAANCEDITIGNIRINGAKGDGISILSDFAVGATKNIVLGTVNITDCRKNGLRIYDTVNGVTIAGGVIKDNNVDTGFVDFRVDPNVTNVQWSSLAYGSGSGQVGDAGADPYKESGLNTKGFITFSWDGAIITTHKSRGVAQITRAGTGIYFVEWEEIVEDDDPVSVSGSDSTSVGVFETTATANRTRVHTFNRGTATAGDSASPIMVSLLE